MRRDAVWLPAQGTSDEQHDRPVKGAVNQTAGAMKRNVDKITGSTRLQAEGMRQQVKGNAQTLLGEAKQGMWNAASRHGKLS